ncbi:hypothetical protein D3C71_1255090 [compost metagenome]
MQVLQGRQRRVRAGQHIQHHAALLGRDRTAGRAIQRRLHRRLHAGPGKVAHMAHVARHHHAVVPAPIGVERPRLRQPEQLQPIPRFIPGQQEAVDKRFLQLIARRNRSAGGGFASRLDRQHGLAQPDHGLSRQRAGAVDRHRVGAHLAHGLATDHHVHHRVGPGLQEVARIQLLDRRLHLQLSRLRRRPVPPQAMAIECGAVELVMAAQLAAPTALQRHHRAEARPVLGQGGRRFVAADRGATQPCARQGRIALQVVRRRPHRDPGQHPHQRKRRMAAPVDARKPALLLIHRVVAAQAQDSVVVDAHVHVDPTVVRQCQRAAPMVRQLDRQLVAQEQLGGDGLRVLGIGQYNGIELAARPVDLLRRIRRPATPGQPQRQHRRRRGRAGKRGATAGHGRGQAGEGQQPHHGNPESDARVSALGDFCRRFVALAQDLHAQGVGELALVLPAFRRRFHRHHVLQRPHLAAGPLLALLLAA